MYGPGIEAFVAILREGSISKAARHLHLAQSTVSKRIKLLEESINMLLFARGKGLKESRLTLEGEAFVEMAERWMELSDNINKLHTGGPRLRLIVGSLESLNNSCMPRLYNALINHRPALSLQIKTLHSLEMYTEVERRTVDVGFALVKSFLPGVHVEPCYQEPMVGICLCRGPVMLEEPVDAKDLESRHEIYVTWGDVYRMWHDQWWTPDHPGRVTVDTSFLALNLFCNEKQWSIVPRSVALKAARSGRFSLFRLVQEPPERICYKVTHKHPYTHTQNSLAIFNNYLRGMLETEFGDTHKDFP